jgi:hypothetical protein
MPTKDEALKMAISFASVISETYATGGEAERVINACEEALEQPSQEPVVDVARVQEDGYVEWREGYSDLSVGTKLYTHPAKPLTDDEIKKIIADMFAAGLFASYNMDMFARAIEQAHGIGKKE